MSRKKPVVYENTFDKVNYPIFFLLAACSSQQKQQEPVGTGHYPMIEKPSEFNALLQQTLDDIAKGK
jgi:hypothetical protein